LPPRLASQFRKDLRPGKSPAIRTIAGHCLEGVTGMNDASLDRNVFAAQSVRISATIPSLMLGAHHRAHGCQKWDGGDDPLADHRVLAHHGHLFLIQGSRLVEHVARNADLADIVEQGTILQKPQRLSLESKLASDGEGEGRRLSR